MANNKILTSLIAFNAIGLIALCVLTFTPDVTGQAVVRADRFTAVVGEVRSRVNNDIVYVVDTNTNRMVAVEYNLTNQSIEVLGHRDMNRDLKETARTQSSKRRVK